MATAQVNDNTQSRKWLITINNPKDHDFEHDKIKDELNKMDSVDYWCMSDEIGQEGTYHTHLFIYSDGGIRFSTVKRRFPPSHIDKCNGTAVENRNYCYKDGEKYNKDYDSGNYEYIDEKGKLHKGTNYTDTHEEDGIMPVERQGARNDLKAIYDMVKNGISTYEIMDNNPKTLTMIDHIEKARMIINQEKYKNTWRNLEVVYIWGVTGTGKTRSVMERFGYENVYRVTDYDHPFDSYKCQDIVLFEEFRSSLRIDDMLKYLDGYPIELSARYNNKVACFTKVFICTNIDLRNQYRNIQRDEKMTWDAFIRRIHKVKVFTGDDVKEYETKKYLDDEWRFHFGSTPFAEEK